MSASAEQVLDVVRDAVVRVLEVDPSSLTRETRLAEDLRADSLALVEIVELAEDGLAHLPGQGGFHIDDNDAEAWRTLGDAVDYACGRLR